MVDNIMHTGDDIPVVKPDASVSEALLEMSRKRLGMTTIVDEQNHLLGIFTDGDLRRTLEKMPDFHRTPISAVMTKGGRTVPHGILAAEVMRRMDEWKVNQIVVVDDQQHVIGALNMHDLLKAGVV
jgi:arabinose-5-phosphate isomerase